MLLQVVAFKTSIGFVDSVWEVLGTLGGGGTVSVIPAAACKDPEQLVPCSTLLLYRSMSEPPTGPESGQLRCDQDHCDTIPAKGALE